MLYYSIKNQKFCYNRRMIFFPPIFSFLFDLIFCCCIRFIFNSNQRGVDLYPTKINYRSNKLTLKASLCRAWAIRFNNLNCIQASPSFFSEHSVFNSSTMLSSENSFCLSVGFPVTLNVNTTKLTSKLNARRMIERCSEGNWYSNNSIVHLLLIAKVDANGIHCPHRGHGVTRRESLNRR